MSHYDCHGYYFWLNTAKQLTKQLMQDREQSTHFDKHFQTEDKRKHIVGFYQKMLFLQYKQLQISNTVWLIWY